jgi:hypothetical protein
MRARISRKAIYCATRLLPRGKTDPDTRHKYTSLPLIPEEEFLALHPEHQHTDPHNLMIARLKNEKVVREELEKQRTELLVKKQALIAENKKRKDDLASLDEQLKKFSTFHSRPALAPCSRLIIV